MRKDTRFKITLGAFTIALASLLAAQPPVWWSSSSTPVVDPSAPSSGVDQNYAPANLGQLKFMAKQAKQHLDANLNGGSGSAITSLVNGFTPQQGVSYTQAELDALRAANYAPINLGQLKAVAKPFYDRLDSAGYNTKANLIARGFPDKWSGTGAWTGYYPWNPLTPKADNYAPANLGQLKMVFSFDLSGFDSDGDGMPDTWEIAHGFNPEDNSDGTGTADADGDGLSNLDEFQQNSDPNNYYSQGSQTITPIVSISDGNNQSGSPGGFLPEPIKVSVTNADGGAPLIGAPVSFTAATGAGGLASEASFYSADSTITIPTDSAGIATAYWKLGANPGLQQVSAQSGSAPAVTFSATSLPADGLWGHWRFFEGTGTIASDTSGFGHPGTLTNSPAWVAGQNADGALSFSGAATEGGTKDYVTMGNPADRSLDFGEDSFTMAVWVKFTTAAIAPGQFGRRIVSKGHHGWNAGYCLGIMPDGTLFAGMGSTVTGPSECIFFNTQETFNDGQWHHVAVVFDRSASTGRILVDGARRNLVSDPAVGGTLAQPNLLSYPTLQHLSATRTDMPLTIGSHMGQYDFYKGELDDVRLYRRALSDQEIAAICGQTGLLKALAQNVTFAEDTLGTITLKSTGGADTVATTYEIITPPANGEAVLNGATISYYPKAHFSGADSLTFRATNGSQSSEAAVAITVTPVDDPPLVSVGGGRTVTLPTTLALAASVTDVDTPPEQISPKWMKVSGPGDATFSSDSVLNPTVTFSAPGAYVLRLTATDGSSMRSDSLQVVANPSTTTSLPIVTLSSPADNQAFSLNMVIPLVASVSAPAGTTVDKVEFFEGSRKIGESLTAGSGGNYGVNWTPSRLGAYFVSAKATLAGGAAAFASGGVQVRVTQGGWFNDSSITAGNEGYSGSGGNGGISLGANSGPSGDYANSGSSGGGPSAGNPVGQGGSDVDSDGDGLSDDEEALRGTIANGEAGYDTDGDGLSDSQDAVPTNAIMKVKAAPEVSYAIVDLGASNEVGNVGGINDRGEVLLIKGMVLKLWGNGVMSNVSSEAYATYGLTQDGSVYYRGASEVEVNIDEFLPLGIYLENKEYRAHSPLMVWTRGGGVSTNGYADSVIHVSRGGPYYLEYFDRVPIPETLPGLSPALQTAITQSFSEALAQTAGMEDLQLDYYGGYMWLSFFTSWVNDAGEVGNHVIKSRNEWGWAGWDRTAETKAEVFGWNGGEEDSYKYWKWYDENGLYEPSITVEGNSGKYLQGYKRYSNGFTTYSLDTPKSDGSGTERKGYANGVQVNGSRDIIDASLPDAAEGPYFAGSFGQDANLKPSLWCFNGGNPERIELKKMPSLSSGGGLERRISKNLVIPVGDIIWRNGRTRSLADLTGMTGENPVWTDISASLISPKSNLIAATASREGANHSVLLLPFEVIPGKKAQVSADDHTINLVAQLGIGEPPAAGQTDPFEGSVIEWQIESGDGGTLAQTETTVKDGLTAATLNTATTKDTTYIVKARIKKLGANGADLGEGCTWIKTPEIEVVAGKPYTFTFTKTKNSYRSDGTDTTEITAEIKDQHGNLVEDGTPVTWGVDQTLTPPFDSAESTTTDGKAKAVLRAPLFPADQIVTCIAGGQQSTTTVTVTRVTGSINGNVDLDIGAGQTSTISVNVQAADGTPVFWTTSNGEITQQSTVSGGSASATLSAARGRLGKVVVTATIGDRLLFKEGDFTSSSGLAVGADHPVLIANATSNGTRNRTFDHGITRAIPYYASTPVRIKGPANALVQLTIDSAVPVAAWPFNQATGNVAPSEVGGHGMTLTNAVLDDDVRLEGAASLRLEGLGQGSVADHAQLTFTDQFNVFLWVNPEQHTAATLTGKAGSWQISQLADGRIQAAVTTESGTYTATTTTALPLNQWTSLEVDFRFNRLQIKTGDTVTAQTSTSGNILVTTSPILVGSGFYGNLDRLTLRARATATSFATFSGLGTGDTLQLDANGEGSFTVTSNGAATDYTDIRIRAQVNPEAQARGQDPPQAEARIAMVDHDVWDYTCDSLRSLIGGDPLTGPGTVASIAGGFLVVGDIGSVVKNIWRMAGWSDKDPNYVELTLGGIGIFTTLADVTGVGAALDAGVAALKTLAIRIGTSPVAVKFLNVFVSQIKRAITAGEKFGWADANFIKKMVADAPVADAFKTFLHDDALAKTVVHATEKLEDKAEAFYQGVKRAHSTHGAEAAKKLVQTFDGLSDEALAALKNAPASELDEAFDGLAKVASKGISPEAVKLALNNTHLFGTQYKRANLLKDLGELADVKGLDDLVGMLKTGNKQAKGFRYELEGAAWLMRRGDDVFELSKKVSVVVEGGADVVKTDIDVVVREGGQFIYYQFKRSKEALGTLNETKAWVAKAQKALSAPAGDYSRIKYALPNGASDLTSTVKSWFEKVGVQTISIPHLD